MNVSGTVCQLIHYFPGKQGLAPFSPNHLLKIHQASGLFCDKVKRAIKIKRKFQFCLSVGCASADLRNY